MLQLLKINLRINFTSRSYKSVRFNSMMSKNIVDYNIISMRQKKKIKMLTHDNSNLTLQVLGSGAIGAPCSIFVTADHVNYMFNCGEGTQRLAHEYHCKLSKLDHIFVTRPTWKNIGGIPGILLTIQEIGVPTMNIHCSEGMNDLLDSLKQFVRLSSMRIVHAPIDESKPYEDNVMTVWYVPISKAVGSIIDDPIELSTESQNHLNISGKRVMNAEETEENCSQIEKKLKITPNVICYICEIKPKRGKLSINKCIQLGVEAGPHLRLLKEGKDFTREDGTVILSKDVCTPDGPKFVFAVVECPMEEYLDSLVNHPAFSKYSVPNLEDGGIVCIFHCTPEAVVNNEKYQDWINTFPQSTQHILLNDENYCMGSEAVYKNQHILNLLHPEIFPLLKEDCFKKDKNTEKSNIHRGRTMQTLDVLPYFKRMKCIVFSNPDKYINEIFSTPEFEDELTKLKKNIKIKTAELELLDTPEYPRIVMLGTGSSIPNKVRNTSAILLRVDENTSILMDCGEGTFSQIIRLYGTSNVGDILRTIKAVYISHLHADHQIGLVGLLQERGKYTDDKVYLIAPGLILRWLNLYHNQFEPVSQFYKLVDNCDLYLGSHKLPLVYEESIYNALNIKEINTIHVKHCKFSYGVAVTLKDGRKIVYSGDAMPCDNLLTLGEDCDLLIHEATMEDGLQHLARTKSHSTTSQAINAGKSMNAKFILLTHFSQRYSKIPLLSGEEVNVGLAYDNMDIKLWQLPLLSLFYPCIKLMFKEYYKIADNRRKKRMMVAV
ncbi:ribonuclease Z, mitochondrial [Colletes gigas]|uniref:ribonuclease Z, mitochondrial n=1 Tax=Colletes gigas TaxID=935657 RepID=UPI001C9B807E|nr:ribonuclease Z, mitochondrial [Colletes gigas]XP_043260374.1 ribonuclease Z, mitochondrial [Colletes gigas]XP_043260381.1 ribonuclease Z, mitochondrial [Colletes gigas]